MNRRRMMMESGKKLFVFTFGSGGIINTSGNVEKSNCYINTENIEIMCNTTSLGETVRGWISIPVDLTGFRKICFDVGSGFDGSTIAFGYDDDYSPSSFSGPELPEKSVQYVTTAFERKIIKIEIDGRNEGIKDIAAAVIQKRSNAGSRYSAVEIYNIWLE